MGKSISEVLTALTLCGANYRADSCKACPLNDSCKPGDNAALVDAATEAITDLVAFNALCLQEKAGLLQVLKHARVTVYVLITGRASRIFVRHCRYRADDPQQDAINFLSGKRWW